MGSNENKDNKPLAYKNVARSAVNAAASLSFALGIDKASRYAGFSWNVPMDRKGLAKAYAGILAMDLLGETLMGLSGYSINLPNVDIPIVKDLVSFTSGSLVKITASLGAYLALKKVLGGRPRSQDLKMFVPLLLGSYLTHVTMPAKMVLG